jgi:cobalt-zinc-cadmium efflux system outer membrane protein
MRNFSFWLCALILMSACAMKRPTPTTADVSRSIEDRSGHILSDASGNEKAPLPPDVDLTDSITEDEVVALALWSNAALQADLASLGFSRADVIEAGLLRNPVFSILFPLGPKQLESTISWPVEALWQRPRRIATAQLDANRAAENLVEHGLDVIRNARYAHSGATLALERLTLADEHLEIRRRVLQITEARLRAGDISQIEVQPARNDVLLAEGEKLRYQRESGGAATQLVLVTGSELLARPNVLTPSPLPLKSPPTLQELLDRAYASRPEMRAAELAIEVAGERLRWQRSKLLAFTAMLDMNGEGKKGFEAGPGLQAELFTLDRNSAGLARAAAEMEQASRRYVAVRQKIGAEVSDARLRYEEALQTLAHWRDRILPPLQETAARSERAFAAGDVSTLFVLENTSKLVAARNQYLDVQVALRRARADLERAVGRRIDLV